MKTFRKCHVLPCVSALRGRLEREHPGASCEEITVLLVACAGRELNRQFLADAHDPVSRNYGQLGLFEEVLSHA